MHVLLKTAFNLILIQDSTRCCTLRRAKNTPTRSFVSNLYISQQ